MEKIKALLGNPLYTAIAGVLVGLVIGLPILGWGLWPVKWKDADPTFLRQDIKDQYLCMIVDSYRVNDNAVLAKERLNSLGIDLATSPLALDTLQSSGCNYSPSDKTILALKTALLTGTETMLLTPVVGTAIPLPTQVVEESKPKGSALLLSILCAVFLVIGGVLVYIFFVRNRQRKNEVPEEYQDEDYDYPPEEVVEPEEELSIPQKSSHTVAHTQPAESPAAHFMTTYMIGDDLYDDSFSIDAATGEFLGECGVGISDTIGVGDPKKVTAFEVWLFDKNDIQTVTKVLMSTHAINDTAIRQRLASKGEPILVEPDQQVLLETASLQLEARVIEMVYGQGALPTGSFFERLTLEITVWQK